MPQLLNTRWISESTAVWHVVCPGPSLKFDLVPDDGNPVVCINLALKVASRCDFWVCWDSPGPLHQEAFGRAWELKPVLVTGTPGSVSGWHQLMSQSRLWTWDRWLDVVSSGKPWGPPWYMEATKGAPCLSVFYAIGWALEHAGTDVRLYGCDMSGAGYFDEKASRLGQVKNKPKNRWDKRWKAESAVYEAIKRAAPRHGVRVSRCLPDGTSDS